MIEDGEVRECVVELLTSLVTYMQGLPGCILKPAEDRPQLFNGQSGFEIRPQLRRAVVPRIKIMAGMDITVEDEPQVGYILLEIRGTRQQFVVQTRPTQVGEELMIRVARPDDPTFPPVPSDQGTA